MQRCQSLLFRLVSLESVFILAVVMLLLQIFLPLFSEWRYQPGPGVIGIDSMQLPVQLSSLSDRYVCYLPKSYDDKEAWPLIIFLHGSGSRGNDPSMLIARTRQLVATQSTGVRALVVLPQCIPGGHWQPEDLRMFLDSFCEEYKVDRKRIYLLGYSMGAFGAWSAAVAYPESFAAIVPLAGVGPEESGGSLAKVPTWAFHGALDKVVSPKASADIIEAIRASGGTPRLTVYPNAGHSLVEQVLKEKRLWEWLFMQRLDGLERCP